MKREEGKKELEENMTNKREKGRGIRGGKQCKKREERRGR